MEKHSNTIVINRKITEDEKILLFSRADYCFAGFKKDFTSSSGVLVDCIELQVPFLSTKQQEISQSFIKDKNCVIYEPGNFKELSALMKSKILKNGKRIDKKVKVPLEMTKKYFFETLSF